MAGKTRATKTINPLHFEDLEPHRFEDLVRRLLYGFRDWSNIEPTGRGGSDEGFDVRAWERDADVVNTDEEGEEGVRKSNGRLWQIQAKREKTITPARMRAFIRHDVDAANPPYGYVMAAATNITKSTYDTFRSELKKRGVLEAHFWGKDHLEDQLALPQNDEILFTFFGLSLSPQRRSRVTEVKFNLNNKNKIQRFLFGSDSPRHEVPRHKAFLLRDIKDTHYPRAERYRDFDRMPRWGEHDAVHLSARGLFFTYREYYAHIDTDKKTWDYSAAVDITPRKQNLGDANRARLESTGKRAERFWRHLPLKHRAKFMVYGFVAFEDMLLIDDKGDAEFSDPHIFVDFGKDGPFSRLLPNLVREHQGIDLEEEGYKRTTVFPATFPDATIGTIHELSGLGLSAEATRSLPHLHGTHTLYGFDGILATVSEGDIIHLAPADRNGMDKHFEITNVVDTTVCVLAKRDEVWIRDSLRKAAGREIIDDDQLRVCEVASVFLTGSGQLSYVD